MQSLNPLIIDSLYQHRCAKIRSRNDIKKIMQKQFNENFGFTLEAEDFFMLYGKYQSKGSDDK